VTLFLTHRSPLRWVSYECRFFAEVHRDDVAGAVEALDDEFGERASGTGHQYGLLARTRATADSTSGVTTRWSSASLRLRRRAKG
jgi:hypothetical protein